MKYLIMLVLAALLFWWITSTSTINIYIAIFGSLGGGIAAYKVGSAFYKHFLG